MNARKIEIVSPAGNFEKLKFAVAYGADAVYFGGEMLNLRENADNFTAEQVAEAVSFCRERGVRPVFLINSFLHEHDIAPAREYLASLRNAGLHSIMVSDPGMLQLVRESGIRAELQMSTQMSTLNHLSVRFWQSQGVKRIVLARETTLDEIRMIRDNTDAEIEVFAHGALCIAYSGRCLLSRYMTGRDSNQGNCAHPCRWDYHLSEAKRPGEYFPVHETPEGTEILSSKDLCLLPKLREYAKAGVDAFKLEGRMKSVYYVANVTRIYKDALNTILSGGDFEARLPFWRDELDLVSHRPFTQDLFREFEKEFEPVPYITKAQYMGYCVSQTQEPDISTVRASNPIKLGMTLDAIFPIADGKIIDEQVTVLDISENGRPTDMARPDRICDIRFDKPVAQNALFRKRNQ
jgi:putative protease